MTYLIQCQVADSPCPPGSQVVLQQLDLEQLAQLGFSASSIVTSISFGFGVVFFAAVIGIAVRAVIATIRQA